VELAGSTGQGSAPQNGESFRATVKAFYRGSKRPLKALMPEPAHENLRGKRFLVVEDEFLILLDIQHILEGAGAAHVATATRLAEAETMLARDTFDAVLLDLKLDKETSLQLAAKLAAQKIPFLFMTGAPGEANQAQAFGEVPVVGKPFDSAAMLAALSKALAGRN